MAVIHPVLQYVSLVWHYPITRAQNKQLESIQKRAVCIVFNFTRGTSYSNLLFVANLNSLKNRRDKPSIYFFQKMCNPASRLHHLLPPPRSTSGTSRLRSSTPLPRLTSRTKKFQSFVNFALKKYQSPISFHLYLQLYLCFLLWTIIVIICTYLLFCTCGLLLFCIYRLHHYYFVALFPLHCYSAIWLSL